MLLNQNVRGLGAWRTIYYLPAVLPAAATALLWRWMFASNGLINYFLKPFLDLFDRTADLVLRPGSGAAVVRHHGVVGCFWREHRDLAGRIEGNPARSLRGRELSTAPAAAQFFNVTIPMLSPTLFYVLIMGVIASLQTFTVAFFIEYTAPRRHLHERLHLPRGVRVQPDGICLRAWLGDAADHPCFTLLVFKSSPAWVHYEGEKAGSSDGGGSMQPQPAHAVPRTPAGARRGCCVYALIVLGARWCSSRSRG